MACAASWRWRERTYEFFTLRRPYKSHHRLAVLSVCFLEAFQKVIQQSCALLLQMLWGLQGATQTYGVTFPLLIEPLRVTLKNAKPMVAAILLADLDRTVQRTGLHAYHGRPKAHTKMQREILGVAEPEADVDVNPFVVPRIQGELRIHVTTRYAWTLGQL
jgi:hypothetical protein